MANGSSLLGAGLAVGGQFISAKQAQQAQKSARRFAKRQYASRYQQTSLDLQLAGFNPILALTSGGITGTPLQPSVGARAPDIGPAAAQGASAGAAAISSAAQRARARKEVAMADSQIALIEAQTTAAKEAAHREASQAHLNRSTAATMNPAILEANLRTNLYGSAKGQALLSDKINAQLGLGEAQVWKRLINPFSSVGPGGPRLGVGGGR